MTAAKDYSFEYSLSIDMAGHVPLPAVGQTRPFQLHVAWSCSKVALNVPFQSHRLLTYGGYSSANMEKAHEAAVADRMSVQKTAGEHGVPLSTLHD